MNGKIPVLLLHGGGSSGATWRNLRLDARMIAPDLRGHGDGPRARRYPLEAYEADAVALLDELGLDEVDVIGHSLGAYAAVGLAAAQPQRVRRLVLEDMPTPPLRTSWLRMALLLGAANKAVVQAVRQLKRPDPAWWERLDAVTARTLVLSGGPTSHIREEDLRAVVARIPDSRLVTIPVGHRIHSLDPETFAKTVTQFLNVE